MYLLLLTILALLIGPVIYGVVRRNDTMLSLMDGFIFVTITGLVLLFILPETFEHGGWPTFVFALVGLFGPTFFESFSHKLAKRTHILALALGLTGLGLHALMDGAAISDYQAIPTHAGEALLPLAIVLHRLPVGLTVWWLVRPNFGKWAAGGVLTLIAVATVLGFGLGPWITSGLNSQGIAWFQSLVAGSLLHVVFHQPHLKTGNCGCAEINRGNNWWEGSGALLGLLLLAGLFGGDAAHGHGDHVASVVPTFWIMALESAPALLIGYLLAGLIHGFLPLSSVRWVSRGSRLQQSLRGMAVGLPMPVCSCGVVPLYRTLIRRGAPATAGMAFLIATPELGLDAILLSIPLLGGEMTLIRVAAAALVAIFVGWVVGGLKSEPSLQPKMPLGDEEIDQKEAISRKLKNGLELGLGEVVDHTAPWILFGLVVAALAHPLLSAGWLSGIPPFWQVPLFTLLGLPAYVCASGATPLVAVLLSSGISPGAALAFLLTGPATNITTFGILSQLHNRRVALLFSTVIIASSMGCGYLVNAIFPGSGAGAIDPQAEQAAFTYQVLSLAVLAVVFLLSILRRGARRFVAELFFRDERALDLHPHYH